MTQKEILNLSLVDINQLIVTNFEDFTMLDEFSKHDNESLTKHTPSKKKKLKKIKKLQSKPKYKQEKKGNWAKHSRRKIKNSETTNRAFINKASKTYIPNRTQKY